MVWYKIQQEKKREEEVVKLAKKNGHQDCALADLVGKLIENESKKNSKVTSPMNEKKISIPICKSDS